MEAKVVKALYDRPKREMFEPSHGKCSWSSNIAMLRAFELCAIAVADDIPKTKEATARAAILPQQREESRASV